MQGAWQTAVVGLVVLLAAVYCLWYVLPRRWRLRLGQFYPALAQKPQSDACKRCGKCQGSRELPEVTAQGTAAIQPIHFQRKP